MIRWTHALTFDVLTQQVFFQYLVLRWSNIVAEFEDLWPFFVSCGTFPVGSVKAT